MEFRVLGSLEVSEGGRVIPIAGKQRALLAMLLLHANEVVSADRLADALWGERPPATAQNALQVHVSQLRKLLGAERIETRAPGYRLVVDDDELDSARFERLLAAGRVDEALQLWRGRPLAEFEYESWAFSEIARLEELRFAADETRFERELAAGRAAEVIPHLESLIRSQPLRERPRAQLMRALYSAGRQADALALYQETRRTLVEELGIEPGPELQDLYKQILNQDPGLAKTAREEPLPARRREERKVVTVLFCDLVGFTPRAEEMDPEDVSAFLSGFHMRLRAELERFGGTVEKFAGDAVMALFGAPVAHEDDAERAVRSALSIRDWIAEGEEDLQVRIGIATGVALVRLGASPAEGQAMAVGDVVNTAARLQQAAPEGAILVGEHAYRATRNAIAYERIDPVSVKGKTEPLPVWTAKELRDVAPVGDRPTTPFIGRHGDLAVLEQAYARTVRERSPQLVTIVGEPGIGKTRMLNEFRASIEGSGESLVRQGRCLAYGDGITFLALAQIVKQHAGIYETDPVDVAERKLEAVVANVVPDADHPLVLSRLAVVIGAGDVDAADQEQTFAAWRTFFEAIAAQQPFVLLVEDLHWAEAGLFAFLDHLVEWSTDVPLLVVATARPELYERARDWGAGKRNATTVALAPLSSDETRELVAELLTSTPHSEDAETILVERVEGNPLYAEEFARWLAEGGSLSEFVPDNVQAVIAARMDTLAPDRKELMHAAAVVGKVFWAGALAAITRAPQESVLANLHELGRKELVRRVRSSTVEGDVEYLFWHVLVRDVAYAQIPRAERARMHTAAAEWIGNVSGEGLDDQSELLAHHYSTALELERAVHGAAPRELEQAAVAWTIKAGDHASRLSLAAARTLYESALALMDDSDPERASVLTKLGGTLLRSGEFALADATLGEAIEHASAVGDDALQHLAMIERMQWRILTDPWSTDDVRAVAVRAIDFFEGRGDEASLAKAWQLRAHVENAANEWGANTAALERALEHARRAGDARAEADALWWLSVSFYFGPTPVDEAIRRCEEILSETWAERTVEAGVLGVLGALYAMQGRFDEARARFGEGLAILEQLGVTLRLATRRTLLGAIELLADDPVAAERELRWALEWLQAMGEHGDMPGIAAQLAEALYRQGRYEEAEPFAKLSEDEKFPRMRWRGPWAKLLARRGEFREAEQAARSVVVEAGASDNLNMQGNALMDLAEVLQLAGRPNEAIEPLQEAVRIFTEKGNVVAAAKARAQLEAITVVA